MKRWWHFWIGCWVSCLFWNFWCSLPSSKVAFNSSLPNCQATSRGCIKNIWTHHKSSFSKPRTTCMFELKQLHSGSFLRVPSTDQHWSLVMPSTPSRWVGRSVDPMVKWWFAGCYWLVVFFVLLFFGPILQMITYSYHQGFLEQWNHVVRDFLGKLFRS